MSVALFVPAVCENSAQFFYENRYVFLFSNRLLKDPNGQKKKNEDEANQNRMLKKKKRIMGFDHGTDRDGRVYR